MAAADKKERRDLAKALKDGRERHVTRHYAADRETTAGNEHRILRAACMRMKDLRTGFLE